jgi:DNA invertase Pin-like site-specific DNA recombinase
MHKIKNKEKAKQLLPIIKKLALKGLTRHDISTKHNISHHLITNICTHYDKQTLNKLIENGYKRGRETKTKITNIKTKELSNIINLIESGFSTSQICNQYEINGQQFKQHITPQLTDTLVKKLKQNRFINQRQNGLRSGYKKGEPNNKHYPLIKKLLYQGISATKMQALLLDEYNISISATAIVRVIRSVGVKEDILKLKQNALEIQSQTCLKLVSTKTSKPEQIMRDIILEYFPNAQWKFPIKNSKGFYWEIDVALPEQKIAFEYDCLYWHSKDRDNFRDKDLLQKGWVTFRFVYLHSPSKEELQKAVTSVIHNLPFLIKGQEFLIYTLKKSE